MKDVLSSLLTKKRSLTIKSTFKGRVYVCATPIGNLDDASTRLKDVLNSVELIAAEDTRKTATLLKTWGIETRLISLQKFNEAKRVATLLDVVAEADIAIVSDAGTPNVSDPGALTLRALSEAGVQVVPVPGPSSIAAAMSICPISGDRFLFGGFFPRRDSEVAQEISKVRDLGVPVLYFEAPTRISASLERLKESGAVSEIWVGRELTKKFETTYFGNIGSVIDQVNAHPIKGEWVMIISFTKSEPVYEEWVSEFKQIGLTASQAKKVGVQWLGLNKNKLYEAWHRE